MSKDLQIGTIITVITRGGYVLGTWGNDSVVTHNLPRKEHRYEIVGQHAMDPIPVWRIPAHTTLKTDAPGFELYTLPNDPVLVSSAPPPRGVPWMVGERAYKVRRIHA